MKKLYTTILIALLSVNFFGQECVYQSSPINNNQSTINISQLPSGIYFIQVTDQNKSIVNRKIVKE
jgi:hypothetical protein